MKNFIESVSPDAEGSLDARVRALSDAVPEALERLSERE